MERTSVKIEKKPCGVVAKVSEWGEVHREWSLIVHRLAHVFHEIFRSWEMPKTPMEVLMYLKLFHNNVEPSVMADFMCIPRQTMTSILDGMDKDGYIERNPHPSDRRKKLVRLSRRGAGLAERILKEIRHYELLAMNQLSEQELVSMLKSLRKFSDAMEQCVRESEGGFVKPCVCEPQI